MATPPNNSYAPPKSFVADTASDEDTRLASRGSRFAAACIDGLIIGIPLSPAYVAAMPAILRAGGPRTTVAIWSAIAATGVWFYVGLGVALGVLAVTAVLVHRNGQTIGKKLLGIKDVRKDGSRAGFARIFWLRYLVNTLFTMLPVVGPLYALIDLMFIFGSARRCCHDYLADTLVVRA